MAGLLKKQGVAPDSSGGMPGGQGGQMPPEEMPDEESNVTPEEQADYDEFVTNGMKVMYSKDRIKKFLQSIEGGGNAVKGLANAVSILVMRLEDDAKNNGKEFSGDVMIHAAQELMEQMAELAEAAGIHTFTEEEMESAFYLALDRYRSTRQQAGTLPVDEIKQDVDELRVAEQQGRLEEIAPGITEYAQQRSGRPA